MYIKYTPLLTALLLISSFNASALQLGGIPVNAYPEANDDSISLVAGVYILAEGNVSSNDRYGTTYTLNGSWVGKYGLITSFDSDGEYTYALFEGTTNDSLPANGIGIDTFRYTLANEFGQTDSAELIIDIRANPNPSQSPIAVDDHESVVISEKPSAIGNVSTNDLYGSIVSFNQSTGQYGFITLLDSSGSYIYTLFQSTDNATLGPDGMDTDSFTYTYTNSVGLSDTAQLIINVSANPSQSRPPIANDDQNSVIIAVNPSTSGNVSNNDRYGSIVTFNEPTNGKYGFLSSTKQSGEYTYQLFEGTNNDDLPAERVDTETFTYTLANEDGATDNARLIISVTANPNLTQPVANDDHGSVVIGVKPSVAGDVTTNDLNGDIVTFNGSSSGQYGFLTPTDSKGGYIYKLFDSTDGSSLPPEGVGIDNFTYTLANASGATDTAQLIIDVSVTKADQPIANDDHESVVIGEKPSVTGNVIDNDFYGNLVTFNETTGQYGFLTVTGQLGSYTYQLFSSTDNSKLPPEGVDSDSFSYSLSNSTGLTSNARLIIQVSANPTLTDKPIARDDNNTAIPDKINPISGDLTANDENGNYVRLISSPVNKYGTLIVSADGKYDYSLNMNTLNVINLKAGEVVKDEFDYNYFSYSDESNPVQARLTIQIIGNPLDADGNPIFEIPNDSPYDNVDIEFNNRSIDATPLNSNRNIRGHLYDQGDKDWFSLSSAGNEIISLEVCPRGTTCFGKKSWVLYVFDPERLKKLNDLHNLSRQNVGEYATYNLKRWLDETGSVYDESGRRIINGIIGSSNHMYLAYEQGYFESALIGIVDPCFDKLNTVDIGVGPDPKDYLIAISSPLLGDGGEEAKGDSCGQGSVILQEEGLPALGHEASTIDDEGNEIPGEAKTYTTTQEHIIAFPSSDDQYTIKITGTGLAPLNSTAAIANSTTYDPLTGDLDIRRVRVGEDIYQARLKQGVEARSADSSITFILADINLLSVDEVVDTYRATFNPETLQVMIPRVTVTTTGKGYSVILQFHTSEDGANTWFEAVNIEEINKD